MKGFMYEAYELLESNDEPETIIDGVVIRNFLVDDILNSCENPLPLNEITNSTKCSKSVIPFAIKSVSEGKSTKLCFGNFGENVDIKECHHVWVVSDNDILQTSLPNTPVADELTTNMEIELIPNDVSASIQKIKETLKK